MIRALYGGSFDPVHTGHLAVITMLVQRELAQVVHVLPANQSPFKSGRGGATANDRFQLLALALTPEPAVVLDDRELHRQGPNYTVHTLRELVAEHPDDTWRLIIGADHAPVFHLWQQAEQLLELAEVVVVARGPVNLSPILVDHTVVIDDFQHPAEATAIRNQLAAGRLPSTDLLPHKVADTIIARGLYGWPRGQGDS